MAILEKNKSWVKNKNVPDPAVVIAPANTEGNVAGFRR